MAQRDLANARDGRTASAHRGRGGAKALGPERIGELTASIGATFHGEDGYFIEIQLAQDSNRDEAADKRIALRMAIRDRLVAGGDEIYPYVRILNWHAEVA